MSIKPEAARLLTEISRILASGRTHAYIVGGFVRDSLLGRSTADIDIAVDDDALDVASGIADELHGRYIPLDDINLVGRVVLPDTRYFIDFTSLKGAIKEDLAHRDFTVNAMAYELDEGIKSGIDTDKIIDPFNGRHDISQHTIKALNPAIFKADAARLLRALRIAAELDFNIDLDTEKLISENSALIHRVAGERIREELLRLLAVPGAGKRFFQMDRLGLLTALIPELAPAKGVDQPHAHVWDVFNHTLQTVNAVEFVLRESDWEYSNEEIRATIPWSERLARYFSREISAGSSGRAMLKLAALLHDIAKPQTKFLEDGHARFFGHHDQGAAIAGEVLERLRFSRREIQLIQLLIKFHLRPTQMSNVGFPSNRAIYRFFRDLGEAGVDVLFLSLADHLAARGAALAREDWDWHANMTAYVLEKHFEKAGPTSQPRIIDGRDIMEALHLPAGPVIGEILGELKEAQAAGEITDKPQAIDYIKHIYKERYNNSHI